MFLIPLTPPCSWRHTGLWPACFEAISWEPGQGPSIECRGLYCPIRGLLHESIGYYRITCRLHHHMSTTPRHAHRLGPAMTRRRDNRGWQQQARSRRRRGRAAAGSPPTSPWWSLRGRLLPLLAALAPNPAAAQSSWGFTYNVTAGVLSKAWDYVTENVGTCMRAFHSFAFLPARARV